MQIFLIIISLSTVFLQGNFTDSDLYINALTGQNKFREIVTVQILRAIIGLPVPFGLPVAHPIQIIVPSSYWSPRLHVDPGSAIRFS